ncbi:unnamed protein product [Brassica oleracea var. botrytis]
MRQLSKHEWVEVRFGVSTFSTSANFIHGCCCSHLPLLLIAYAPPRFSFAHRRQSVSFSASSKKSLPVVSAAKKAVSVLKGNSDVERVVTLTQEDTSPFSILILNV